MANRKVEENKRKKPACYSIESGIFNKFSEHCISEDLKPSNIVEKLIIDYLNRTT